MRYVGHVLRGRGSTYVWVVVQIDWKWGHCAAEVSVPELNNNCYKSSSLLFVIFLPEMKFGNDVSWNFRNFIWSCFNRNRIKRILYYEDWHSDLYNLWVFIYGISKYCLTVNYYYKANIKLENSLEIYRISLKITLGSQWSSYELSFNMDKKW